MAQFTAHSRVKLLLNGDGLPFGSEPKDRLRYKLRSVRTLKRRVPLSGTSTGLSPSPSSTSALRKSSQHFSEVRVGVRGESVNGDNAIVDLDYDYEFESDDLACFRGLVLDISYRPVNVVCWKRAICLEFMEKADVLEYYDQTVSSPSGSFYIPAVLRVPHLLQVVKRRRIKNSLSRKNILYRDNYTCQYCSSHESLTIDHVLPISRGGEWTWENLVAACVKCNSKKGQKTVEEANMKLKKTPKAPKDYDILAIPLTSTAIKMLKLRKGTPEEWRQYLSSEQ